MLIVHLRRALRFCLLGAIAALTLQSCKMADLRTAYLEEQGGSSALAQKGRAILEQAAARHGYQKLLTFETFELIGKDEWAGLLGSFGNPWPVNNERMRLQFAVNSFDSRMEILEGDDTGLIWGLQSWQTYMHEPGDSLRFEENEGIGFALAAYSYFLESPGRLLKAPIIYYAGEKEFEGQLYDQVFVTWESLSANDKFDQYLLWINRSSGRMELINFTVRENYQPAPPNWYGSIRYSDYRAIAGVEIPHVLTIQLNAEDDLDSYIHRLTVESFSFDGFPKALLYPDRSLGFVGDSKPYLSTP